MHEPAADGGSGSDVAESPGIALNSGAYAPCWAGAESAASISAELAERRERVGEQAVADVQARWETLIPRVQQAVEAGTDPASPEAQEMAREWMELLEQFHGGDDGLRDSLHRMYTDNTADIQQQYGGPSPQHMEFIERADAARS